MSSYATLIDYLGDQRPPERLTVPPGGPIGMLDQYLCDIADAARSMTGRLARTDFITAECALLARISVPVSKAEEAAVMKRLADWRNELRLTADNYNGGRSCTARY